MATASSFAPTLQSDPSPDSAKRAELLGIDRSTRTPALLMFGSAVVWLVVGTVLGLIASWKLHTPTFLADAEWLTYGRVQPAATTAFLYGWGFNVAFAIALWLMARLSRAELRGAGSLIVATLFWNLGVTLGVVGILIGDQTSLEWLEMPAYAAPLLLVAYAMIGAWAFVTFRARRAGAIYASQWYLFAALLWFPWIFSVAQVMLMFFPARGTIQSIVNVWYSSNLFLLWFVPVALAAVYYFLPKLLGRAVNHYYLSGLAFWWMAVFASWAGLSRLIGGPVPAWVQTVGSAASFMLLVPLFIYWLNFPGTLAGAWSTLRGSATLRFIAFGVFAFLISLLWWAANGLQSLAVFTQFTYANHGLAQLGLYGFFSMVAFGSFYYIVPRLLGSPWPFGKLIDLHFWSSALGIALIVAALTIGGVRQGLELNNPELEFMAVTVGTFPWLFAANIGGLLLAVGHVAFALNFFRTVCLTLAAELRPLPRNAQEVVA